MARNRDRHPDRHNAGPSKHVPYLPGQADLVTDLKVPFSFTCADAEIEADAADLRVCNSDFYPVPHHVERVASAAGTTTVYGYALLLYLPTGGTTLYAMHGAGAITDMADGGD
tara:strand:- start:736 stop:1074 length:339 start_codon:yes stop_codon:yes gene_type:complete